MKTWVKHTLAIVLLLLVPVLKVANAQSSGPVPPPRVPAGIYAVVPVADVIAAEYPRNERPLPSAVNKYLKGFYAGLLSNAAVSGLALQVHWDDLNPNPPTDTVPYVWDWVDDAFASVDTWNAANPTENPKTIQLIVTPGFNSPQWVLDELAPSCDSLFYGPAVLPGSSCGEATFSHFKEKADGDVLPMPWNPTYQAAWKIFLTALAARYEPYSSFVSIAVAGPTAASAEMLLPNGAEDNQTQFESSPTCPGCNGPKTSAKLMWQQLLSNAGYAETDAEFVTAWEGAIDTFGGIFTGVTLVATTGNGLPNLGTGPFAPPYPFGPDCADVENADCEAETTILAYFMQGNKGGSNAKASQTSGLDASRLGLDLGIDGVKFLSQLTMGTGSFTTQILAGAQFTDPVSTQPVKEGANKAFPKPSVDQALYNVLQVFFTGTVIAPQYCVAYPNLPAPMNYLEIYYEDFQYADSHGTSIVGGACFISDIMSAQDELNRASEQLSAISEP
jgi:hypothetical protein